MRHRHQHGVELDGPDQAREELRLRAKLAIGAGLKAGRDVRHIRVRLTDEQGTTWFAGTLAEAAAADEISVELPLRSREQLAIAYAQQLCARAADLRLIARDRAERTGRLTASLKEQAQIARDLMEKKRGR